jgi:hypothetical protein
MSFASRVNTGSWRFVIRIRVSRNGCFERPKGEIDRFENYRGGPVHAI